MNIIFRFLAWSCIIAVYWGLVAHIISCTFKSRIEKRLGKKLEFTTPAERMGCWYSGQAAVINFYIFQKYFYEKILKKQMPKKYSEDALAKVNYQFDEESKFEVLVVVFETICAAWVTFASLIYFIFIYFNLISAPAKVSQLKYYQFTPPSIQSPTLEQYDIQFKKHDITNRY